MLKSKLLLVTIFSVLLTFVANAQEGESMLSFKIGVGARYASEYNAIDVPTVIPPLKLSYESFIDDDMTVGGFVAYYSGKLSRTISTGLNNYNYKTSLSVGNITVGGVLNYYIVDEEPFQFYAGLELGYTNTQVDFDATLPNIPTDFTGRDEFLKGFQESLKASEKSAEDNANASPFYYGLYIGGRYFFNDKLGANVELGYSTAVLSFGLTYKF